MLLRRVSGGSRIFGLGGGGGGGGVGVVPVWIREGAVWIGGARSDPPRIRHCKYIVTTIYLHNTLYANTLNFKQYCADVHKGWTHLKTLHMLVQPAGGV